MPPLPDDPQDNSGQPAQNEDSAIADCPQPPTRSQPTLKADAQLPRQEMTAWKAFLWEMLGLVLVIMVGGGLLAGLSRQVDTKKAFLAQQKEIEQQQKPKEYINVETQAIVPTELVDGIRLPGMLKAWRSVSIPAEVGGTVIATENTPVDDGERVEQGQPLLHIDARDYRIGLSNAKAALELARTQLKRARGLRAKNVTPQSELDAAQATFDQAQAAYDTAALALARCTIVSPIEGAVHEVVPEIGEYLGAGDPVATVLENKVLKAEINIPEKDYAAIRGLKACEVYVTSYDDPPRVTGKVAYLSPAMLSGTRVYRLRLKIDNAEGRFAPGMFLEAEVVRRRTPGAIVIPLFALLAEEEGGETIHSVFVVENVHTDATPPEGVASDRVAVARRRQVRVGLIQEKTVEIVSGLSAGERLVVTGQRQLDDGVDVRLVGDVAESAE